MGVGRGYLAAVVLLAVLAVAFGVFGTVAPPLAEEGGFEPQEVSSESVGHFQNPPSYDSGWVDITTKTGQYMTLNHGLNTTDAVVDVSGKVSLDPMGGALAWSRTYGGTSDDVASSVVQASDGGYAVAGFTASYGAGGLDAWLVKTDSMGNVQWNKTYGGTNDDQALGIVRTTDGGYAFAGQTKSFGAGDSDIWLAKIDALGSMQWNRTYGGSARDVTHSLIQTSDGGYAMGGYTYSFGVGPSNFWLVKTDGLGITQWNRTYGGSSLDEALSVVQTIDGGYAVAGYTWSFGAGASDFWLVRTDSAGNMQWNKTYGGTNTDSAWSVIQESDGGYVLGGETMSFGAGLRDFYLVKTDAAGSTLWSKTFGGANYEWAFSVAQTGDGGYSVIGYTNSYGAGSYDFWLVKTGAAGNMQWNKTFGGAGDDEAISLVPTSDEGYAMAGFTASFGAGLKSFWLLKVNAEMNLEHHRNFGGTITISGWSRTYGGTNIEDGYSMIQTIDGGYALAGYTSSYGPGIPNFWFAKTDSAGNMQWSRTYGGTGSDIARDLTQTSDGGYALAGSTTSFGAGGVDFWLVKTDATGNTQWSKTYGGTGSDYAWSMVQTIDGGYALAGDTNSFGAGGSDFWLVKANATGTMQWSRTYGGTGIDVARDVIQTSDGGYALAGYTWSLGAGMADFWLVKTDASGIVEWNKTYGETADDAAYSMVQTIDGGYALAGDTYSFGAGGVDFWLVKTDASGIMEWNKTHGGTRDDYTLSMVRTDDGGYAQAGYTYSYGAGAKPDFWLVKTDSAGNMQWTKTHGGTDDDRAYSVVQTTDGGYALAGPINSFGAGSSDFWLVKTDIESGLARTHLTNNTITLYRGKTDLYWNYVRVRIWVIKEPSWIYGDINMDGVVDSKDLYIIGRNYGKTFSLLSLGGIICIAGIRTVKKRKQGKQPSYVS